MKLICPNCDAQYVVDDDMIPDAGRDVQCSNCGSTWFQQSARMLAEEAEAALDAKADRPAQAAPEAAEEELPGLAEAVAARPRRAIDDAVLEVLREEAEREKAARAGIAPRPAPVVGPAVGDLPPAPQVQAPQPKPVGPVPRPVHRSIEEPPEATPAPAPDAPRPEPGPEPADADLPEPHARRERLPDIEAINSTLRASADPARADVPEEANAELAARSRKRSGFRVGFGGTLFVAAMALVLYIHAPRISQAVPGLTGPLETYVGAVDKGRIWLDQSLSGISAGGS